MMIIRGDQMKTIVRAGFRRRGRELIREVAASSPALSDRAATLIADAERDAETFGFADPLLLDRYVRLVLRLPPDGLADTWGGMLAAVIADTTRPAQERLDFIERHLAKRVEAGEAPT